MYAFPSYRISPHPPISADRKHLFYIAIYYLFYNVSVPIGGNEGTSKTSTFPFLLVLVHNLVIFPLPCP
jgi:hypothetical protein